MSRQTADRPPDWADHPALERLREELVAVAHREAAASGRAPAPRRSRTPRLLRPAAALAMVAVLAVILVATLRDPDGEAVAGIRDAPSAAERQGSFAFDTQIRFRTGGRVESLRQEGTVRYEPASFAATLTTGAGARIERVGVGDALFYRLARGTDRPWSRTALPAGARGAAAAFGPAGPSALAAVRALGDARGERVVGDAEQVDGVATTHFQVAMAATAFLGTRDAGDRARLRGVEARVDVWLDAGDLPRRLDVRLADDEGRALEATTRYADYGRTDPVAAPSPATDAPAGETESVGDPVVGSALALFGG